LVWEWLGRVFGRRAGAGGELIEADGGGLAEVHGWLAEISGDFNEDVAEGEVFAREAVLFRAEDEGDFGFVLEFSGDEGSELIEADDGLFGLSVSEGAGTENESAVADGL
jgi:hypothetical protein